MTETRETLVPRPEGYTLAELDEAERNGYAVTPQMREAATDNGGTTGTGSSSGGSDSGGSGSSSGGTDQTGGGSGSSPGV